MPAGHHEVACPLVAGDLEALFLPERGMLGASLRYQGAEILRRVEDLDASAAAGSTAGTPFLHPWANRLAGMQYRAGGREVVLDPSSRLLHFDEQGLPIHGVPWSRLAWHVATANQDGLTAVLEWNRGELLAVFPCRHRVELSAMLGPDSLTLETRLIAGADGPVPLSFGFHPYLGLPNSRRSDWRLALPPMRRLELDQQGIPTGEDNAFGGLDTNLDDVDLDAGFALLGEGAVFTLAQARRRLSVELLSGYRYARVFAPKGRDYVALEPMTAPANALVSGNGLRLVGPGSTWTAAFRIRVELAGEGGPSL
jgi:aldose 1-epimerase